MSRPFNAELMVVEIGRHNGEIEKYLTEADPIGAHLLALVTSTDPEVFVWVRSARENEDDMGLPVIGEVPS